MKKGASWKHLKTHKMVGNKNIPSLRNFICLHFLCLSNTHRVLCCQEFKDPKLNIQF